MKITLFIAIKFRICYESAVTNYIRDSFDVAPNTPLEEVAEIINQRMDDLSVKLNRSIYAQLHAHAS